LPAFVRELARRLFANPWLLLILTCLFWGGNVIAARSAIGHISPISIVTGRWAITCAFLFVFYRRDFIADLPLLKPHWRRIVFGAFCGFGIYHSLYYVAAHYTSGINLSIVQGVTPIFVFLGAFVLWRTPVTIFQAIGCAMTICGVLVVAAQGDLSAVRDLQFNIGDIAIVVASVCYAMYTLTLRNRPKASSVGYFFALGIVAVLVSLPVLSFEMWRGQTFWPTTQGWIVLLYVAICPTLLAQIFYIRSVELIGPGRATLFYNMTPVLGALLSTALLGEPLGLYHIVSLALVVGGVTLAEKLGRK
jgi:drug/metabolite transporter (DMT)-like permease